MGLKGVQKPEFRRFCEKYLNLTEGVDAACEIDTSDFDVMISGSDQIWNPLLTGNDSAYFLDFADDGIVKASYAASIGIDCQTAEEHRDFFETYIPDYRAVSLREKTHLDMIKQMVRDGNVPVTASVDPTLLLSAEEYSERFGLSEADREKYIFLFTYNIKEGPKLMDFANMLSLHTGYPVVAVIECPLCFMVKGTRGQFDMNPVKWLQYIKNAALVLTDSYHGLMLSIAFRRPFYVYPSDGCYNVVRITDALEMFGLEDRKTGKIESLDDVSFRLDYSGVEKVLAEEKSKSEEYLRGVLEMAG